MHLSLDHMNLRFGYFCSSQIYWIFIINRSIVQQRYISEGSGHRGAYVVATLCTSQGSHTDIDKFRNTEQL